MISVVKSLSFLEPIVLGTTNFSSQATWVRNTQTVLLWWLKRKNQSGFWGLSLKVRSWSPWNYFIFKQLKRVFCHMNTQLFKKKHLPVQTLKQGEDIIRNYFEFLDLHRTEVSTLISANTISLPTFPFRNTIRFYLNIVVWVVKSQRIEVASLQDLTVLGEEINYLSWRSEWLVHVWNLSAIRNEKQTLGFCTVTSLQCLWEESHKCQLRPSCRMGFEMISRESGGFTGSKNLRFWKTFRGQVCYYALRQLNSSNFCCFKQKKC